MCGSISRFYKPLSSVNLWIRAADQLMSELMSIACRRRSNHTKEARNEFEFRVGPVGVEPTTSRL
jgi:hypothetical protein